MKKEGFVLREFRGIHYYSCTAFENIPNLCHGFSTRKEASGSAEPALNLGYCSWDSIERVDENRRRLLSALNMENFKLATLHQVHSSRVHIIEDNSGEWNQGDALATQTEEVALAVIVADCLPVLIADPVRRAVAAVHSGWRGTLSRVLPQSILAMQNAFGSDPCDLIIAIGPGIRDCCFEVGQEVMELFEREYPGTSKPMMDRPGKYLLDLCRVLDVQLDFAGVRGENRYDLNECTACNTDMYFSYRSEGAAAGRMMAAIGLKA